MATLISGPSSAGQSAGAIIDVTIPSAEKRREGGKHYVYEIEILYESGTVRRCWRRYSQFDALRDTMMTILPEGTELPKLTKKLYLQRSSVRQVAGTRMPKLQEFLQELLTYKEDAVLTKTLTFFLTPTAADEARALKQDPDDIIVYPDGSLSSRRSSKETGSQQKCIALWDYSTGHEDDLELKAGDIVTILCAPDAEWYQGRLGGRVGIFPSNYVELVDEQQAATAAASAEGGAGADKPKTPEEELMATERAYIGSLKEVREDFFPRIRANITAPEAKQFFNNWAELIPCSEALLETLEARPGDVAEQLRIGLPKLVGAYTKYCAGIPVAQDLYNRKIQDLDFQAFESGFPDLNKPTLNYIMRPVQRIMKYPLLIMEIRKKVPKDSADFDALNVALEAATQLANQANGSMDAPIQQLNKLDISGPSADSFQVVAGLSEGTETRAVAAGTGAGGEVVDGGSATPARPAAPAPPSQAAKPAPAAAPTPASRTPKPTPTPTPKPQARTGSKRRPPPVRQAPSRRASAPAVDVAARAAVAADADGSALRQRSKAFVAPRARSAETESAGVAVGVAAARSVFEAAVSKQAPARPPPAPASGLTAARAMFEKGASAPSLSQRAPLSSRPSRPPPSKPVITAKKPLRPPLPAKPLRPTNKPPPAPKPSALRAVPVRRTSVSAMAVTTKERQAVLEAGKDPRLAIIFRAMQARNGTADLPESDDEWDSD